MIGVLLSYINSYIVSQVIALELTTLENIGNKKAQHLGLFYIFGAGMTPVVPHIPYANLLLLFAEHPALYILII